MSKYNLLQKGATVHVDPYPHILIEDALPWDIYEELERTFPENAILSTEPFDKGICYRYKADKLLQEAFKPEIWREFCEYHTSAEFFNSVIKLFEPWVPKELHKQFTENHLGARGWADGNKNLWTDCQLVMHKPITEKTTRTPHLDNPMEIYAGLLYFPHEDDSGTGGDFQIHKAKNYINVRVDKKAGRQVNDKNDGGITKTAPYKRNSFVMFCNVQHAIHSVSKRINPTQWRRSVNIIGEFARGTRKMFNVEED
jgi:hypothetical protein